MRRPLAPVASVALACLALAPAAHAQPTDWVAHYHRRVAAFAAENARLDPAARHVVLIGDSLTEGWTPSRIARSLPTLAPRVLNRGITSDGTGARARGVSRRLDASLFDCQASHAFLLIGVNDVGRDGSGVEPAARTLREVVRAIRAREPALVLTLITCPPARGATYGPLNPAIVRFNAHVRTIAREEGAHLIDLHPLLVDARGELPAHLTGDGIHWTDAAYAVLGRELERVVREHPAGSPAPAPAPSPPVDPTDLVEVTAPVLRVRTGVWGTIVGYVTRGTRLPVLERRDGWLRVRWRGGEGWVSGAYARPVARSGGITGSLPGG